SAISSSASPCCGSSDPSGSDPRSGGGGGHSGSDPRIALCGVKWGQSIFCVLGQFLRKIGQMSIYRAPGRVNLIGEHTDYNDGYVMPVAIDRYTTVTAAVRGDRRLSVRSEAYEGVVEVDLDAPGRGPSGTWSDYVRGVAAVLERNGRRLRGADLAIASTVPLGAGLSSSAAIEVSTGFALLDLAGQEIDRTALALACRQAEQEFAGSRCGVRNRFIACHGRAGQALLLDTRTLDAVWLPLPADVQVIVCNTMTRHSLASDGYNERRADCEAGVRALAVR